MKKPIVKENTEKKTDKRLLNLREPWKKGECPNKNGRPLGQRNYATIYREALMNLAKAKKVSPERLEEMIEELGLKKALSGDYRFFQDVRDRIHGKPIQKNEISLDAKIEIDNETKAKSKSAIGGFLNRRDSRKGR